MYHNVRGKDGKFKSVVKAKVKKKKATQKIEHNSIVSFYLLDDTGSMLSKRDATINGFNQVLRDSRKADKANNIKSKEVLALFGEMYHFKIQNNINELTRETYNPGRPFTALWWSIKEAIQSLDNMVKSTDKVVFTIITDGFDNASQSSQQEATRLIKERQDRGWVINFIGAGDQATIEKMSASVGIFASNTMNYVNNSVGTQTAFAKMSSSRSSYSKKVKEKEDTNIGFFAE